MKILRVSSSAIINAPARQTYAIIADYRDGHPHILPKPYFVSISVEQGGIGAGTVISFTMRVAGQTRKLRGTVTEPEPGRVLVETNEPNGSVTTFTVEPRDDGRRAQVTIATDMPTRDGVLGPVERFLMTRMLRRIYAKELALLAALAERRAHG